VKIIEVDDAAPVPDAGDRDDPRARHGQQAVQDQAGERERAEMVGGEGQLEAVLGDLRRPPEAA
jgi:hypothetical protein